MLLPYDFEYELYCCSDGFVCIINSGIFSVRRLCRASSQFYIDHSDLICQLLMETTSILVDKYPANPYANLRQQDDDFLSCSPMKMSGKSVRSGESVR